jgi:DNA repair protein RecO
MEVCEAILVRKRRWSESSLIVTWLTDRFGALQTSARGALRPGSAFAGKLDLFHRAEIGFTFSRTSTLHSLREVSLRSPASGIAANYPALALASYFSELAAAICPPMQPSSDIHDLLLRALDHLEKTAPTARAFQHFEREAARLLGVLDPAGQTPPHVSLSGLCGVLPRSRGQALSAVH